ncbi:MAG TPA: DUF484 family protein [Burkholderiaceae bacterium]|jgi:uncharacterized protein YigA (DUF484 family)|nr:DUF484 family protein [Burkholderiaceae bacterium]
MNEDDVANFIQNNPEFFRRKPWLLGLIELPDPHDGRAVSLAERQTQILRERIRSLEASLAELTRNGRDNDALGESLARWSGTLLAERDETRLPQQAVDGLREVFAVPAVAVRIWEFAPRFADLECTRPAGDDVMRFAASMQAPFCGMNADFEAANWMKAGASEIRSLALIPLRTGQSAPPFGLLTLGSADLHRFRSDMGTAFLSRIGQLAAAALSRLRG